MNKKGFTLIELIAIIIIVGTIGLISFSTVTAAMKKMAIKQTGIFNDVLTDAASIYVETNNQIISYIKSTGQFKISVLDLINRKLVKNDIDNPTECELEYNYILATYDAGEIEYKVYCSEDIEENPGFVENAEETLPTNLTKGTAVYVNPETKLTCREEDAVSETGTKTGCMKWYVYKDNGNGTYQLLLDHNTTATVEWVSKEDYIAAGGLEANYEVDGESNLGNNDLGPITAQNQLNEDTETWNNSLGVRLITAEEVAEIIGSEIETSEIEYEWLYDNTCINHGVYSCFSDIGYWTSTPAECSNTYRAWYVDGEGYLYNDIVGGIYEEVGVRPVITF